MKLLQILNAKESWARLAQLRKPPKTAYRLLKYFRKVSAESETIEAHRIKCVYEAAGGPGIDLVPPDPRFAVFLKQFNEFLEGDSDLQWSGMPMDELIAALDAETGNVLSEADLDALEPFFTAPIEPAKPAEAPPA